MCGLGLNPGTPSRNMHSCTTTTTQSTEQLMRYMYHSSLSCRVSHVRTGPSASASIAPLPMNHAHKDTRTALQSFESGSKYYSFSSALSTPPRVFTQTTSTDCEEWRVREGQAVGCKPKLWEGPRTSAPSLPPPLSVVSLSPSSCNLKTIPALDIHCILMILFTF